MSSATSNKPSWTPGDEPSQKDLNLLNQRVIQFTDTEDTTLDVWLQLENADLDEEAAKFLNAGLLFEHYLSQLPNDPAQRSSEQVEQLETYRRDFETALDEGRSALASAMSRLCVWSIHKADQDQSRSHRHPSYHPYRMVLPSLPCLHNRRRW